MTAHITRVTELPGDLLIVEGTLDGVDDPVIGEDGTPTGETAPRPLAAQGWVSALSNHFDDDSIDPDTGQRKEDAAARAMTAEEEQAYYARLLEEQYGALVPVTGTVRFQAAP